jgi:predicted O-linked N-acetylglucosamine transferase (SPINDLY family)
LGEDLASFEQVQRRAKSLEKKGDVTGAVALYQEFLDQFPKNTRAKTALDRLTHQASQPTAAKGKGGNAEDRFKIVDGLLARRQFDQCIAAGQELVRDFPEYAPGWNLLGIAFFEKRNFAASEKCLLQAVALSPDYKHAYSNLGVLFFHQEKLPQALQYFSKASSLDPENAGLHNSMGAVLFNMGKLKEAEHAAVRAIKCDPNFSEAYNNLANALYDQGKYAAALEGFIYTLKLKPDHATAHGQMLYLSAQLCNWAGFEKYRAVADTLGLKGPAVMPFGLMVYEDNPEKLLARTRNWVNERFRVVPFPAFERPAERPAKLKIGYFSADFHNHATLSLMMGLLRHHDRDRFEIHAYSYGTVKGGEKRQSLVGLVDHVWDIQAVSDVDIVKHARDQGIDIAIDLKGFTQQGRTRLFAHRMAPVQINYLGYPGSIGGDFMDYIVADKVIIPDDLKQYIAEKIIYLPECYQPNDEERVTEDNPGSRAEFGLPETGFVFSSFNSNYKISPREFDIWMRLLKQVEGSVLWLLRANEWAEENLRKEAVARGVDPDRLIFAPRVTEAKHVARQTHADLFLDTFNVNAHTTASDALWAGLPVLTKVGRQFPARVAASINHTVGLDDLIVETEEAYEALALDLATHPEKLVAIRARLVENIKTGTLFDSERYTRHLETGFAKAYDTWFAGNPPADIEVEALPVKPAGE